MDSADQPDQPDQPVQTNLDDVHEAIKEAKAAEQHLRDVAPDAIDEVETHEDVADEVSAAGDS